MSEGRRVPASPRNELVVAVLLVAAALAAAASVAVYVTDADTQWLGVTFGGSLVLVAAALIVAGNGVVPQEERAEERPPWSWPESERRAAGLEDEDDAETAQTAGEVAAGTDGVTRRRLLVAAGGTAGAALGAAAIVPLASLGPGLDDLLRDSPWSDGVPLVDVDDKLVSADDIEVGAFLTAFPQGADKRKQASPIVVVHVDKGKLDLPPERDGWAPEGLLAYSKICTHAGCAVNLFRSPLYPPRSPGPALVCPCHYSTFDVLTGGDRIFGPAGRPLPQLPLRIDANRRLVAGGDFSGSVGPGWSSARKSPT
jgi:ubiquinol-cytochrome c reductase iron-sulfur subunit